MGDRRDGTAGVVGAAIGEIGAALPAPAEQLDMLPPSRFGAEDHRGERMRGAIARHRAGRPPGAQNKATRDVKEFCRRVFGLDPMVEGFRWALHTPETLAAELSCSKLEAYDRLAELHKDLRRYFYAPLSFVDDQGQPVPSITMVVGGQHVTLNSGLTPWQMREQMALQQRQQNQSLGIAEIPVSHAAVSHEGEK